jgi:transcriptional regulator with XRE-family HTH domain
MGELAKTLGQNIREERKKKGFSQDAFALAAGIDRSYIGRIERGEVNITVEKLYEIAAVLQCELESLLPDQANM